jgi:hypothetical protein
MVHPDDTHGDGLCMFCPDPEHPERSDVYTDDSARRLLERGSVVEARVLARAKAAEQRTATEGEICEIVSGYPDTANAYDVEVSEP